MLWAVQHCHYVTTFILCRPFSPSCTSENSYMLSKPIFWHTDLWSGFVLSADVEQHKHLESTQFHMCILYSFGLVSDSDRTGYQSFKNIKPHCSPVQVQMPLLHDYLMVLMCKTLYSWQKRSDFTASKVSSFIYTSAHISRF